MFSHSSSKKTAETIGSLVDKILTHLSDRIPKSDDPKPSEEPVSRFTASYRFDTPDEFWTNVVARGHMSKEGLHKQFRHFSTASPAELVKILDESVVLQAIDDLSWVDKPVIDKFLARTGATSCRLSAIMKAVESGLIEFRERPDQSMQFRVPLQTPEQISANQRIKQLQQEVVSLTNQLYEKESQRVAESNARLRKSLDRILDDKPSKK